MGAHVSRTDYEWTYTQEPHKTRRKEILGKYPQIKKLMTHDPRHQIIVPLLVAIQILSAYFLRNASWATILAVGYCWGGVINHGLTLAVHEISHNLAFGHTRPWANRLLGIFANLALGIPYSVVFKKYHLEHHKYQGDDELDVDIPSRFETKFFYNTGTKVLWVLLQPFFYAIRPLFIRPKPVGHLELINFTVQAIFDVIIVYTMGWRSLCYMAVGTLLAMGLHPVAGHFISEHYMFKEGYETYSYYGPLNNITFNVGYHNEHHDFPNIPGCNLPEVKRIASEYYDDLPHHTSWVKVIWDFITDPNLGPYARIKRKSLPTSVDRKEDKDD